MELRGSSWSLDTCDALGCPVCHAKPGEVMITKRSLFQLLCLWAAQASSQDVPQRKNCDGDGLHDAVCRPRPPAARCQAQMRRGSPSPLTRQELLPHSQAGNSEDGMGSRQRQVYYVTTPQPPHNHLQAGARTHYPKTPEASSHRLRWAKVRPALVGRPHGSV